MSEEETTPMSQDATVSLETESPKSEPPTTEPPTTEPPARRGVSVPTVVWGLFFALVAAAILTVETSDVDLDLSVSGPVFLLAAGAVLVVWGIAGLGRGRARRR